MTAESKLFLISAASGTGKSSLINSAMTELEKIGKKLSYQFLIQLETKDLIIKIFTFLLVKRIFKIR
ncbi:MAG: hypothetical protein CM15mP104_1500 [Gammaproteobacteria bacterium]|nr:MAG: hypothetical protein CM15mP104_1500 [Gammaproteobacteria bacterium]